MEDKDNPYDCSVCDTEPEGCPGCGAAAYEYGYEAGMRKGIESVESIISWGDWEQLSNRKKIRDGHIMSEAWDAIKKHWRLSE